MKVIWCVGDPGVGKTTVIRALLKYYADTALVEKPKWTTTRRWADLEPDLSVGPVYLAKQTLVAAGHYKGDAFDGADTIPYNGAMDALEFWLDNFSGRDLTILDGDRFSYGAAVVFFQTHAPDHQLVCVKFSAPDEHLAARRAERNVAVGKAQNPTWLKGRATKTKNFFDSFPGEKWDLTNVGNPADVAKLLLTTLEEA